jgi:UDP-N-acetylmuramate: L-alanyl-gamma-D-glutamyl-meso-diaminopimelate ligase
MAACAAGLALDSGSPTGLHLEALAVFRPVRRRQEVRVRTPALTVIEDFGHHPTALAETLGSLRVRYSAAHLTAVFEPRSNTARTKILQAGFTRALAQADEVYLGAVNRAEKLAENERFDAEAVAQQLESHGVHAQWFASNDALFGRLTAETLPPQGAPRVVIFFSNGSFDGIIDKYVAAVSQAGTPAK